ncbi:MAG: sigma-70 family RNA polymerase sigma factor [Planctomycetes bacterium]|nr:sigma-70 family RNA polymerase sigma factor [Planctomycetota bacterium]
MTPPDSDAFPDASSGAAPDVAALLGDRSDLLALARRLAIDDDAEDLVQETQLAGWLHPPGDRARVAGWLRRIATHLAARRRVRRAARLARERSVARREAEPAADHLVAQLELQRALADALLELDLPARRVVLLRFFEQLPPRAIAAQLGLPVETVRTRLKRALARLRERLDGRYGARDSWGALAWTMGATAMSTTAKSAAAAGVLVAALATWHFVIEPRRAPEPEPAPVAATAAPADATPSGTGDGLLAAPASPPAAPADLPQAERRAAADSRGAAPLFAQIAVTGRVVEARDGAPIGGATVKLLWFAGPAAEGATLEQRVTELVSDADGRVAASLEDVARDWFDGSATAPQRVRVELEGRRATQHDGAPLVDLGRIELSVGARVVGRVVLLPERTPVAGATLHLRANAYVGSGSFGPDSARPVATCDGDGRFELRERVTTKHAAAVLFAQGAGRVGYALFRAADDAEQIDVEVALELPVRLRVRVVTPDGEPVPDAEVIAYPTFPPFGQRHHGNDEPPLPFMAREPWKGLFRGLTDEAGWIAFDALLEGRDEPLLEDLWGSAKGYRLHVVAEGWRPVVRSIGVERGRDDEVIVELRPPTVHRVVGRVVDERGGAIAGATVTIEGFAATTSDGDGRYATADRDGPIGGIDGKATADSFAPGEFAAMGDWVRERIATVAAEESGVVGADGVARVREELPLDFTLKRGGRVRGKVVDEAGAPLAGVVVRVEALDPAEQNYVQLRAAQPTDGEGRFVVDGVSDLRFTLFAEPVEGTLAPFPQRVRAGDDDVVVVLQRVPTATARAVVTVRDGASGAALTPVRAFAWPRSNYVHSRPGAGLANGQIVVDALFPGDWELRGYFSDGRHAVLRFRVERLDQQLALDWLVGAPATLVGQLTRGGQPVKSGDARWFLWVEPDTGNPEDGGHQIDESGRPQSGVTDSCAQIDGDGRFLLGRLPIGLPIRLFVEGSGEQASATIVLQSGERRELALALQPAARVEWRIGEALPAGRIVLDVANGDEPLAREEEVATDRVGAVVAESTRPTGRLRWRATWTASVGFPAAKRIASGEASLASGLTTIDLAGFE